MDRVNRSFLVTSTLLAIPTALLMASLSTGTTPEIEPPVRHGGATTGVQQVAGKKPSSSKTRPSLLQVFSGSKRAGSSNHRHKNVPSKAPKGLLDSLLDRVTRATGRDSSSSDKDALEPPIPPPVNWDGIPYHQANSTIRPSASVPAPIRDPDDRVSSTAENSPAIRGGLQPIQAKIASARRPLEPKLDRLPSRTLSPPLPPADVAPKANSNPSFSTGTSSRRNSRKSIDTLDESKVAAKYNATDRSAPEPDDKNSLIPKVARKDAQTLNAKTTVVAKTKVADQQSRAKTPTITPQKKMAIAAIGAPTRSTQEPKSSGDVASLAPTTAAPSTIYTAPVDPATTSVPVARFPAQPYAASTTTEPASHRAGPPSAAFGPGQISIAQSRSSPPPYGQPRFESASTPVGSGVVPNGDVASYRHSGTQPVHESVPRQSPPNHNPYASKAAPPASHVTTYGQPRARQPINGLAPSQQAAPNQHVGDNFARSSLESRNQMRDALPTANMVASELPGIRVITQGPDSIMTRQTSQYEIRVENRGSIDAAGVMVRALVPDWADLRGQNASRGDVDNQVQGSTERLVWTIDHLPAGGAERMYLSLTAARSGTYNLDVDWTLVPQKSISKIQVREPLLSLTIDGPDEVVYGQSQTYTVRVLNPGDGTAPNVVFTLSPNSATPQTQRIGDIPPGKEAQFDVELTAQDLGDLKIHGLASGDLELRAELAKTIRVSTAKFEAVLTGPELKYQNAEAMYSLQVQNAGTATSEKIVATLRIPAGVKYLGGIEQAVVQGNALKWEINSLPPGAARDYQFHCEMNTTGEHVFAFDCNGTAAGNTDVAITTLVESIADLVLSVSDPAAPAPVGSDVIYEIIIRNRGSKEASDVRVVTQFSHGIEPQRVEGESGQIATGQVLFDAIPRIGAGQEVRMRVIAQADSAGHHRFRTEVRSGDTVLVAEEATHYMSSKRDRVSRRSSDDPNR